MEELPIIPQSAIDMLKKDPSKAGGFDQVFGKGRAETILAPPVVETIDPQVIPEENNRSWATDVAVVAPANAVENVVNETMQFFGDTGASMGAWLEEKFNIPTVLDINYNDGLEFKLKKRSEVTGPDFLQSTNIDIIPETETKTGAFVEGTTQFIVGFLGAGKFTKLKGLKGSFVNGAIADAVVFDPDDANVANFVQDFGAKHDVDLSPIMGILATDPEDPDYLNRLRNAGTGAIIGTVFEGIGMMYRARAKHKAGKVEEAEVLTKEAEDFMGSLDDAMSQDAVEASKQVLDDTKIGDDLFARAGVTVDPQIKDSFDPIGANSKRTFRMTPEEVAQVTSTTKLKQGASPSDTDVSNLGWLNRNMLDSHDEVLDQISAVSEVMANDFKKIKGGDVQRHLSVKQQAGKALKNMARMTGEDPDALVARFANGFTDTNKMASELVARERYLLTLETELKEMAQAIADGGSGAFKSVEELQLAFIQRREIGANILAHNASARTNIARAMNAMKISRKGDDKLRSLLQDPTAFRGGADVKALANAIIDPANSGKSVLKVADDAFAKIKGFSDEVNSFRINALLSGTGTQEVNMVSNLINGVMIPFEQTVGGIVSGNGKVALHGARTLMHMISTGRESVKTALKAGWMDDAILDPTNQKLEGDFAGGSQGRGVFKKVTSLPSRGLMTMDELFKQAQYRGTIQADALANASSLKLKGAERKAYVQEYVRESFDESGAAIRGDALLQAQRSTFTEPLDGKLSKAMQAAAVQSNIVRFIVPFVKTPINILSNAYQHVPILGATSKRYQADIAAGGTRRAQAYGKWVVGAGLITSAATFAADDRITGSGPKDPKVRQLWLQTNQPYSWKDYNEDGSVTFTPYSRLEPYNQIFSLVADMVEIMDDPYNQNPEAAVGPAMFALFMALAENSVNKTFTQGIADAFELFSNPEKRGDKIINAMIGSYVPNILNQANGDDLFRQSRTLTDTLMAKTHLYNGVDVKRNVLGEPVYRPISKGNPLNIYGGVKSVDGLNRGIRMDDPLLEEMTRLSVRADMGFQAPAVKLRGPDGIDLSKIKYTETQTLFDKWMEMTGEVKLGGKNLRTKLNEFINSPTYKSLPDPEIGVTQQTKAYAIKMIITAYRDKAKVSIPELVKVDTENKRSIVDTLKESVQSNRKAQQDSLFDNAPIQDQSKSYSRPTSLDDLFN